MELGPAPPGGEGPSSSSSSSAAASTTNAADRPPSFSTSYQQQPPPAPQQQQQQQQQLSRYESQKRRDWNTFLQYLKNHKPPLTLARCSGAHVIEFLKYLDQFGKTKVHADGCDHFGNPNPPATCACPLRQAWGSLDALIGRLRAAYEENGGRPESNPFGAKAVRIYLREVRESQAKARGFPYKKKKRKRLPSSGAATAAVASGGGGEGSSGGGREWSSDLTAPADGSAGTSNVAVDSTSGGGTSGGGAGGDDCDASSPATGENMDAPVAGSSASGS